MRALPIIAAALSLSLAGSGLGQSPLAPDDWAMARREQAAAERALTRLEQAAAGARDRADKLARERQAAAMAIELSEARITGAQIRLARESARLAALRRSLAEAQRPVSVLLAGMAMLGRRPPVLALADRGGAAELVRTRILLDATMPVVRARSAALASRIAAIEVQERSAGKARSDLIAERRLLVGRQRRLVSLENQAFESAVAAGGAALAAGDQVMAGREALDAGGQGAGRAIAYELLGENAPPARPGPPSGSGMQPFAYALPADSPVTRGLAEIDRGGVRSRGLTLATGRGTALTVPAGGTLRFAGPFEDYDGIAIIEHGGGWMTLIVNAAVTVPAGTRLGAGSPLGRALGPIEVELSHNGQRVSPAIIAGSSPALFKRR